VPADEATAQQLAALLVASFRDHAPDAWPPMEEALADARESLFTRERVPYKADKAHYVAVSYSVGPAGGSTAASMIALSRSEAEIPDGHA
jgi:hypothetical protein